jgi:hypothetical protein
MENSTGTTVYSPSEYPEMIKHSLKLMQSGPQI